MHSVNHILTHRQQAILKLLVLLTKLSNRTFTQLARLSPEAHC